MTVIVNDNKNIVDQIPIPIIINDSDRYKLNDFSKHSAAILNYNNVIAHLHEQLIYYDSFAWLHHTNTSQRIQTTISHCTNK